MFIGNYARTIKKCSFCKGSGCSSCKGTGHYEQNHLLISEDKLETIHLQLQQRAKIISGEVIEEERKPLEKADKE